MLKQRAAKGGGPAMVEATGPFLQQYAHIIMG